MSLIQSAGMKGHDQYAYLEDVPTGCLHIGQVRLECCYSNAGFSHRLKRLLILELAPCSAKP
jgi:hypothetical protein